MIEFHSRQNYARGHGEEFPVGLHDVVFFAEDLLAHGIGVVRSP